MTNIIVFRGGLPEINVTGFIILHGGSIWSCGCGVFFFINFRKCIRPVRWLETFMMLVLRSAAELDCQKLNLAVNIQD